MSGFQKNISGQKWMVFAFNTTDNTVVTGDAANITGKIRKDYGSATAITDVNPTEIEDGYYEFDHFDEAGWPHYNVKENLPPLKSGEQTVLMKEALVNYFVEKEYIQ